MNISKQRRQKDSLIGPKFLLIAGWFCCSMIGVADAQNIDLASDFKVIANDASSPIALKDLTNPHHYYVLPDAILLDGTSGMPTPCSLKFVESADPTGKQWVFDLAVYLHAGFSPGHEYDKLTLHLKQMDPLAEVSLAPPQSVTVTVAAGSEKESTQVVTSLNQPFWAHVSLTPFSARVFAVHTAGSIAIAELRITLRSGIQDPKAKAPYKERQFVFGNVLPNGMCK